MGSLDRRNLLIVIVTLVGAALITRLPFPEALSQDGVNMLAIALVGAVFWITECIPIALTGLVIILLQALVGIQPIGQGLSYIATPVNSIVFAGFIMATALSKYDLDRRIGLNIVASMGERTDRLILGLMLATAFLSMWISNSAATAIMMPIALGILKMANLPGGASNLGRATMIGIAYAANIGGMGTPAGTPACSITIAFIDDLLGIEVSFLGWMIRAMPVVIVMIPIAWKLLLTLFPVELESIQGGTEAVRSELREMGPTSGGQRKVMMLFILAVVLWTADSVLPLLPGWLYIASVIIALMFVAPGIGVVNWKEASEEMGWGIFILVGGGLALGSGLNESGVIKVIADSLSTLLAATSPYLVVTFFALVTAMSITFFSSLTATSTTFVPVSIGLALQLGMDATSLAIVAGLASCMAFLLPANTPPNAIVYSSNQFRTHEMTRGGLILTILGVIVLSLTANLLWFN